jgi:hypothetical protein
LDEKRLSGQFCARTLPTEADTRWAMSPRTVQLMPVMALKKIGLVTASAICSVNLWTGAPLFAIWVGSKVQGNLNNLSMTAAFSVIVVLAALVFLLAWALTWINAKYDDLTGRHPAARHTSPWLRSMRDEREEDVRHKFGISLVERVVVVSVVACVLAFEVWFFFFAGSALPNQ